jgi:hypothetical protein
MNNQIVDFERKKLNILHSLPFGEDGDSQKGVFLIRLFLFHPFPCRDFVHCSREFVITGYEI